MTVSTSGIERLRAAMAARVERGELPGLTMLIARGDEVHFEAIGTKAFGSDEPMRRDTLFRIASMTKPILAAATLMLVEDGRIRLDDPIDFWLPELADRRVLKRIDGPLDETVPANRPITLEDLLTSRMGLGMVFDPTLETPYPVVQAANDLQLTLNEPDPRTPHAPDEWIRRLGTLPLMCQPGERWLYNAPFLVLGVLAARVADQPLDALLRQRMFEPLGMHTTGFWLPIALTRTLPTYYMTNFATGQLEQRDVSTPEEWSQPPAFPSGAAGLVSTVDDFLQFGQLLLNGGRHRGQRLLSEASVEAMTTNKLSDEQMAGGGPILGGTGWGYGMAVVTRADAAWPVPGRYGWAGGYGTDWFNDTHTRTFAVVMTQVSPFLWTGGLDEFTRLVGAL
jgi:CubicO group peptidase (beta-lactamase class C family)